MTFLEPYLLYNQQENDYILVEPFDYLNGSYPIDDNGKINSPNEKKSLSDINLHGLTVEDYIKRHNDNEYKRILDDERTIRVDIKEDAESPKYQQQLDYIIKVKSVFKYWYRSEHYELPFLSIAPRQTKQDEFLETFDELFTNPNTTEHEVRERLYNKDIYPNPSALMAYVRDERNLTFEQIQQHPAFSFTGHQGRSSN